MRNEVGINYGVDFERAKERLSYIAGKWFRQYREAKKNHGSEEEIARLRQAYIDAQHEEEALSLHDEAAIQAVLAKPLEPQR
jgi:hypothetical protein